MSGVDAGYTEVVPHNFGGDTYNLASYPLNVYQPPVYTEPGGQVLTDPGPSPLLPGGNGTCTDCAGGSSGGSSGPASGGNPPATGGNPPAIGPTGGPTVPTSTSSGLSGVSSSGGIVTDLQNVNNQLWDHFFPGLSQGAKNFLGILLILVGLYFIHKHIK